MTENISDRFLLICKDSFSKELSLFKWWHNGTEEKYEYLIDTPNSGVYREGNYVVAWKTLQNDEDLKEDFVISQINSDTLMMACIGAAIIHLATKVTKTISEGLPWGQVCRDLPILYTEYDNIMRDLRVIQPNIDSIDLDTESDVVTVFLKSFAERAEIFLKNMISSKFNIGSSITSGSRDMKQIAQEFKEMTKNYESFLQEDDAIFISSEDDDDEILMGIESAEIFEITSSAEDEIIGKCPKCGSSDVMYVQLSTCLCYSCDHQWKVQINDREYKELTKKEKPMPDIKISNESTGRRIIKRIDLSKE